MLSFIGSCYHYLSLYHLPTRNGFNSADKIHLNDNSKGRFKFLYDISLFNLMDNPATNRIYDVIIL